jgi:dTDP-4-dehydrorhamnose reductase
LILTFGGNGQLGQDLARASAAQAVPLVALTRAEADVSDEGAVRDAVAVHRPSLVVNAAAYTKVDNAEQDQDAARKGNETGPRILAQICASSGIPLVHVSTDYVFDGTKRGAYAESDPIAPLGVYGATKAAGEAAVRETLREHVIVRTSWAYGEFGHNFLKTMLRLAATRDELRVVADQRGCPTSSADLARAILRIAPRLIAREDVWGTYHFAGSGVTTWHAFADRIVAAQAPLTGRRPKVTAITTAEYPTLARRPANSELDCAKFVRVFGFAARPWEEETDRITRTLVAAQQGSAQHVA